MAKLSQFLITTQTSSNIASINANSIQFVKATSHNPVTRFIPMKRTVHKDKATRSQTVTIKNMSAIDDYSYHFPALYYVENNYTDEAYGHSVTLYIFQIVKETPCYYFLSTGQRIAKNMSGRTFALTPSEALRRALCRAKRYLDILIQRGENVSGFLKATTDLSRKRGIRELREFEAIARQFKDPDEIPHQLLKDSDLGILDLGVFP